MNSINFNNVSRETLLIVFKISLAILVIFPITFTNMNAIETVSGLEADKYLLIDKDSNVILAGENYDEVAGIASITKVMSYYVYMDKITEDGIDIDSATVPISDEIVDNFAKDPALSGVYFDYGDEYPLQDMFDLMLVYSDNGATKAIGESIYGTEEAAVEAMNAKAKELGMDNTTYYNTTGLTMSDYKDAILDGTTEDDYNVSTAREQLILAEHVLADYPQILDYVGQSTVDFNGYTLSSFNLMLPDLAYDYPGVVGLKTGSSIEAGYCFLGYYIDQTTGKEYLSIVLNSSDQNKRFNDTTYLYNWITDTEFQTLMNADQEMELPIKGARGNFFTVKTNAEYQIPSSDRINLERMEFEYNSEYFDEDKVLTKDIPEGGVVGSYVYKVADYDEEEGSSEEGETSEISPEDNQIESLDSQPNKIKFSVVSTNEIKKEGFIGSIFTSFSTFFVNVFGSM